MWHGMNRRKFPRAKYSCSIFIKKKDSSRAISTRTENIGAGGICVMLDEDLGLFQTVDLELRLDDNNPPIKSSATVVWVVKKHPEKKGDIYLYDTGVEFVNLTDAERERLLKIVNSILKKDSSTA